MLLSLFTTGTQIQRHSVTLCHASFPVLSFLCVTTNTHSASCKQVLFVLSDYKYCFGKIIIIKRRDGVYLSLHPYKTHSIALLEDIPSPFSYVFLFFGFSVKAQIWSGRGISAYCTVGRNNTHTGTLTDKQYCRAI